MPTGASTIGEAHDELRRADVYGCLGDNRYKLIYRIRTSFHPRLSHMMRSPVLSVSHQRHAHRQPSQILSGATRWQGHHRGQHA